MTRKTWMTLGIDTKITTELTGSTERLRIGARFGSERQRRWSYCTYAATGPHGHRKSALMKLAPRRAGDCDVTIAHFPLNMVGTMRRLVTD